MKRKITAAYSTEMPDWLRRPVSYQMDLKRALLNHAIAIDKVNVTDAVPESGHYLTVYLLNTDLGPQVYIPGVNDNTEIVLNNRTRKLGNVAKSKIKDLAIETAYIDLDDPENLVRKKDRYLDPRYEKRRYDKHARYAGQRYDDKWGSSVPSGRDKSGYRIPTPAELLGRYYEKFSGNLTDKVERVYNELTSAVADVNALDIAGDVDVARAYRILSDAIGDYKELARTTKLFVDRGGMDDYEIGYISNKISGIRDTLHELDDILNS